MHLELMELYILFQNLSYLTCLYTIKHSHSYIWAVYACETRMHLLIFAVHHHGQCWKLV